jgi:hypothetical protein
MTDFNQSRDLHCAAYFKDGRCPKYRYERFCPLTVGKFKGYHVCCMAKEGIPGGVELNNDRGEEWLEKPITYQDLLIR